MKESIPEKQLREFGFLIGFGFPIFIGWIIPAMSGHIFRFWSLWVGLPSLMLGIIKPSLLYYPYRVWISLGVILGWINGRVVLGSVFLIVLLPISFIMKIFSYDPLRKKKSNEISYREKKLGKDIDMRRIF
tara:strand:+ start:686 stop:1078 length:393 start_codon:yes stop_codon:yes gene_type:complete